MTVVSFFLSFFLSSPSFCGRYWDWIIWIICWGCWTIFLIGAFSIVNWGLGGRGFWYPYSSLCCDTHGGVILVIRSKIVGVETMIGNEGIAWRSGVAQVKARSSYSGAKKSTID